MRLSKNSKSVTSIFLSGGWGYGNRGDNAILKATLTSMESLIPQAQITISSWDHAEIKEEHGRESVPSLHKIFFKNGWRGYLNRASYLLWSRFKKRPFLSPDLLSFGKTLAQHDLVVMAGGGYFNGWRDMAFAQFALIDIAHYWGTPIVLSAQSIGPFSKKVKATKLKSFLPLLDFITVRDSSSYKLALDVGVVKERLYLTADEANLLPALVEKTVRHGGEGKIEVGVMMQNFRYHFGPNGKSLAPTITNEAQYFEIVVKSILGISKVADVKFKIIPSTDWNEQSCTALSRRLLAEGVDASMVKHPNIDEFILSCQSVDIMFSTNMHPVIIAATAGVPSLALSYHYKTDRYMESLGLSEYCLRIDDFSSDVIIEKFLEILSRRKELVDRISDRHNSIKASAQLNSSIIRDTFEYY